MREDYVSRLRVELRAAAEREARRGPVRHAAHTARWNLSSSPVLTAATLLLVAVLAIAGARSLRGEEEQAPTGPPPRVLSVTTPVSQGGWLDAGFGSLWTRDMATGEAVRIDPRTRRVVARVSLGGISPETGVITAGPAVWAIANGALQRIDPATNRVAARLDVDVASLGGPGAIIPGRGVVWVATPLTLLRVDPSRNVIDRRIDLTRDGYQAVGGAFDRRSLYIMRSDGTLITRDRRSGARLSSSRPQVAGFLFGTLDGAVLFGTEGGVAAVDPGSGRTLWSRDLGARRVNDAFRSGDLLWVHVSDARTGRDRLWRLDARTGSGTGSVALREFGLSGMVGVGSEVFVLNQNGRLVVVG
jgi:outer membrane protein assembly factor BamB